MTIRSTVDTMESFPPGALNAAAAYTIRRLRDKRGLSQEELARIVGLTRRQMVHLESGDSVVSYERVVAIGLALGFKPADFTELIYLQARSGPPGDYDERTRKLHSIWGFD